MIDRSSQHVSFFMQSIILQIRFDDVSILISVFNREQISTIVIPFRNCCIFYSRSFDEYHRSAWPRFYSRWIKGLFLCSGFYHPFRLGNNLSACLETLTKRCHNISFTFDLTVIISVLAELFFRSLSICWWSFWNIL